MPKINGQEPIDFTARIGRQRRKNAAILTGPNRSTNREERARAEASNRALDRVEKRLGIGKKSSVSKGSSKRPTAAARVVEKATGVGPNITDRLRGLKKLTEK